MGKGNDVPEPPDTREQISDTLGAFEDSLLSQDQMQERAPGGKLGSMAAAQGMTLMSPRELRPGESRAGRLLESIATEELRLTEELAPAFQDLQKRLTDRAIEGDPLAKTLRDNTLRNLEGQGRVRGQLEKVVLGGLRGGGTREATQRAIRGARNRGAALGTLDSGGQIAREVLAETGALEGIRNARVAQAQNFLTGSQAQASPGLALINAPTGMNRSFNPMSLLPSPGQTFQGGIQLAGLNTQVAMANQQAQMQNMQAIGGFAGMAAMGGLGFAGGGASGAAAALTGMNASNFQ